MIRFGDDVHFALIGSLPADGALGNDCIAPGALDPVLCPIEEGDGHGAGRETVLCFQRMERKHQGVKTDEQKILGASISQQGLVQVTFVVCDYLGIEILSL